MGLETMGDYILCRTVHTAPGSGMGLDLLSPIVPVLFPVPFPCSVNVPLLLVCSRKRLKSNCNVLAYLIHNINSFRVLK